MGKIITAIFGATIVGGLFSIRKFIGLALVVGVGVASLGSFIDTLSRRVDEREAKTVKQIADSRESRCQRPDVQSAMRQLKIGEDFEATIMQQIKQAVEAGDNAKVNSLKESFSKVDEITATYRKVLIDSGCWS